MFSTLNVFIINLFDLLPIPRRKVAYGNDRTRRDWHSTGQVLKRKSQRNQTAVYNRKPMLSSSLRELASESLCGPTADRRDASAIMFRC